MKKPVSSRGHGWKRSVKSLRPWCFGQSHVDGLFISTEFLSRVRAAGSFTSGFSTAEGAGSLEHLPVSASLPCACCRTARAWVVWAGVLEAEFLMCPFLLLPWLGFQLDNKTLGTRALMFWTCTEGRSWAVCSQWAQEGSSPGAPSSSDQAVLVLLVASFYFPVQTRLCVPLPICPY